MRGTAVWRNPTTVGVGAALLFHLLLGLLFVFIRITVRPMAALPLEVELLAGDLRGPSPEQVPQPAPLSGRLLERRGDVVPLRSPVPDQPVLPELMRSTLSDRMPIPSTAPTTSGLAGPSPRSRLAPLPVQPSQAAGPGVKVRVEGTLSTRRLVHLVEPAFPPDAPSGGVVKVKLVASPDGSVKSTTLVLKAHPSLEEATLEALRQWRFAPVPGGPDAEGVVTVEFVLR